MGLLTGRNKNTLGTNTSSTAATTDTKAGTGAGLTGISGHRYGTRSKGGLFSGSITGPGAATTTTSDNQVGLGSTNVGAGAGIGTHNKFGRNGATARVTGRTNVVGGNSVANDAGLTGSSTAFISTCVT